MALRRGLKAEANHIAREVRAELGLRLADPLDPWALAHHLEIPILPLRRLQCLASGAVHHFLRVDASAFSALTVFEGSRRLIVHNDGHSRGRQASDLAHELAHALLLHRPGPALDDSGCRHWDSEQEDEANWLAAALLVSEEAALRVARSELSVEEAAEAYGVSRRMMAFRLNVTGAIKRTGAIRQGWRTRPRVS